jgi:hypothetical protein
MTMGRRRNSPHNQVRRAFDRAALKRVCEMHEDDFPDEYPDLETWVIEERTYDDYYYYADHGSDILFVAHLDTVVAHDKRMASYAETKAGPVIHSGSLDDRLGAYIGLELLPALGVNLDILLCVGEESGRSTAEFFNTDKSYNWLIEFDRKEDDVVMYQYHDLDTADLVRACGAKVGHGSFSDIAELEHLGVKAFNWGTGYSGNYHSVKGYAYLHDTYTMVAHFLKFYAANSEVRLPHEKRKVNQWHGGGSYGGYGWSGGGYGSYGKSSGTPKSSIGKKWVAGKGWVDKDWEGVKVNGKWYDTYEDWWDEAHPSEVLRDEHGAVIMGEDSLWAQG